MKKYLVIKFVLFSVVAFVNAKTIVLKAIDDGDSTGEKLKGITNVAQVVAVQEIDGLNIIAQTQNPLHSIHITASGNSLGIDNDGRREIDDTTRLDFGEIITLSFDRDLQIRSFDFIGFSSNSVFVIAPEGQSSITVRYGDLSNKKVQKFTTKMVISAGSMIDLYVGSTNSVIGLQGIDVELLDATVLPEISLSYTNDTIVLFASFPDSATGSYKLQYCSDLAGSNGWTTVLDPFTVENYSVANGTNQSGFYRTIASE